MLTGVVCYVERAPGGASIRRIRLIGPELDQSWTPPSAGASSGPAAPGAEVGAIRAAAAWIADELGPVRELAAICLDAEGGVCSWVSTPSSNPAVVLAAIRQSAAGAAAPGEGSAPAAGFGLLPDESLRFGSARSVQALAAPEASQQTLALPFIGQVGKPAATATQQRRRVGVISIADAPARVLIDELDRLRIDVNAVLSGWHAQAMAWDPSMSAKVATSSKSQATPADADAVYVDAAAPVTASVVIDPSGRLTWCWSQDGQLIAAGLMRLRTHTYTQGGSAPRENGVGPMPSGEGLGTELLASTPPPDDTGQTIHAAECSQGDVGRLVMDWLSWSAQLGHAPDRVVCIGPPTISHRPGIDAPAGAAPTPSAIAQALANAWPGASIDVAVNDDPIGATMNRLRTLAVLAPSKAVPAKKSPAQEPSTTDDPRLGLITLSSRAGRDDRRLYQWASVAILAASAAIFLYAHRLGASIDDVKAKVESVQAQRTTILQEVESLVPTVSKSPDPIGMLSSKAQELNERISKLGAVRPILPRLLPALEVLQDPEFTDVQITSVLGADYQLKVDFNVPDDEKHDLIPGSVLKKLEDRAGAGVWSGNWGVSKQGRRPYDIYARTTTAGGTR